MADRKISWAIRAARLAVLCALILGLSSPLLGDVHASTPWPESCERYDIPGHDGEFQVTLTCVPDDWNGVLVVYAHGYVAPQEPLALPVEELGQVTLEGSKTLVESILEEGYAFATTSYSKNGYAVEQAMGDLNALVDAFREQYSTTGAVLLVGASEGGLITVQQIETDPGSRYQGGLALCAPVAGMPHQMEYLGDFRVIFDYFFPGVFNFGAVDVPEDAYRLWDDFYAPRVGLHILTQPIKTKQLFGVTGAALDPRDPQRTAVETALQVLRYNIVGINDAIATTGGIPYDNQDAKYSGSFKDWHLNLKVERVAGDEDAIRYTVDFYQPTGDLKAPLVTLHNVLDPAVPYEHEGVYKLRVEENDKGAYLVQDVSNNLYGHCNFAGAEVLDGFSQFLGLLDSDQQP